jgi:hypothetical protein
MLAKEEELQKVNQFYLQTLNNVEHRLQQVIATVDFFSCL